MDGDFGQETERFHVIEDVDGKYLVHDVQADKLLRYSYSVPPCYAEARRPASRWGNYYAARLFCQKMDARQKAAQ